MLKIEKYIFSFRGGVLEPEGIVEIKFRKKDLIKAIHRIDPVTKELDEQLNKLISQVCIYLNFLFFLLFNNNLLKHVYT